MPFDKVHTSSEIDTWETPPEVFDKLYREFNFDIDVCANATNHKVPLYFNPEINGLTQDWSNRRCWMNPPYGRKIKAWVEKASATKGLTVCLIPARTDTKWWQDEVIPKAHEIRFVRGRIKFVGSKNTSPFPAAVVVFNGPRTEACKVSSFTQGE